MGWAVIKKTIGFFVGRGEICVIQPPSMVFKVYFVKL